MSETFCPATMCPLFASGGSPWTGEINAKCGREACGWFNDGHCVGRDAAGQQVAEASDGVRVFQIASAVNGEKTYRPSVREPGQTYDCPRATECQWQIESGEKLCPPRYALSLGIDPRVVRY